MAGLAGLVVPENRDLESFYAGLLVAGRRSEIHES